MWLSREEHYWRPFGKLFLAPMASLLLSQLVNNPSRERWGSSNQFLLLII